MGVKHIVRGQTGSQHSLLQGIMLPLVNNAATLGVCDIPLEYDNQDQSHAIFIAVSSQSF